MYYYFSVKNLVVGPSIGNIGTYRLNGVESIQTSERC